MEDTTPPPSLTPRTRIALAALPPRPEARWTLLGSYVELVWVEAIGITAVAIARRLARLLEQRDPPRAISLYALATPLGVPPSKALAALRRLHHHGLIEFRERAAVIGCPAAVPDLPAPRLAACSAYTQRLAAALEACPEPPDLAPRPGAGFVTPRRGPALTVEP